MEAVSTSCSTTAIGKTPGFGYDNASIVWVSRVGRWPGRIALRQPVVDLLSPTGSLVALASAAVGHFLGHPAQVIADVALAHAELACNRPVRGALAGQGLDGHTHLQVCGHRYAAP